MPEAQLDGCSGVLGRLGLLALLHAALCPAFQSEAWHCFEQ